LLPKASAVFGSAIVALAESIATLNVATMPATTQHRLPRRGDFRIQSSTDRSLFWPRTPYPLPFAREPDATRGRFISSVLQVNNKNYGFGFAQQNDNNPLCVHFDP